jgi:methyltransferase (TIGR00027 family)
LTGLVYRFLQPPIHSPAFLHINKHTNNDKQNNETETANAVAPATPDRASSVSPVTPVAVRSPSPSPSPSPAPVLPSTPSHSTVSDSFASSATLPTPPIRSGLSKTSLYIAAGRAIESSKPQSARLFLDPFAAAFAGSYGRAMLRAMATEMRSPERVLADYVAVRTKFLDSQLVNALVGGIDQLVLLSVGCDARSLRLEIPQGVTVYEVDSEETLRYRSDVIDRVRRDAENADSLPQPKCRIVPVPADIRFPSWVSALENAGFNRQKRSFFLVEGLLMYLTNAEVDVLLHQLASLTVSHSRMAGDMLNAQYFLHEVVAPILTLCPAAICPKLSSLLLVGL